MWNVLATLIRSTKKIWHLRHHKLSLALSPASFPAHTETQRLDVNPFGKSFQDTLSSAHRVTQEDLLQGRGPSPTQLRCGAGQRGDTERAGLEGRLGFRWPWT
jgi:hypothetical protein